ncbi:MAG: carboxypeptidase-like regulatory domain-containing protein [Maribacter sp.]|nr:carboxypeptidase-like regulatory domain-containing protein [Maribacter sp.]
MKKIIFISLLLLSAGLYSQDFGTIKGTITDWEVNNEPLLFADITIKNTPWQTRTNFRGNFELADVVPGTYTLSISFLGYETLEVPIEVAENGTTTIQETLRAKTIALDAISFSDKKVSGSPTASIDNGDK